jgi:uncharacterized Zn finger protein
VTTQTNFGVAMFDTLKLCPEERAALRKRIQAIEAELTALSNTRCTCKEWAKKCEHLLTEWFDLIDRVGHE